MTSLKRLLAFNMKERRKTLGISQAALAERVNTSAHYIAMIELEKKTASLPMIERIAAALEVDSPELFSMQSIPAESLKAMHLSLLGDIQGAVNFSLVKAFAKIEKGKFPNKAVDDS